MPDSQRQISCFLSYGGITPKKYMHECKGKLSRGGGPSKREDRGVNMIKVYLYTYTYIDYTCIMYINYIKLIRYQLYIYNVWN
jgi:hypothetical protein